MRPGAGPPADGVRLGIALPVFSSSPLRALRAADAAESAGIDGVFCYDHLWPLGRPGTPAFSPWPLLGALAARTEAIGLGTLVARVGLSSQLHLLAELAGLEELSRGRLIAGLGTGDALSAPENQAFGVPFTAAVHRRELLEELVVELGVRGIPTWVGGGAPATVALARRLGVMLNLWGATPARIAEAAAKGPVSWAGDLPEEPDVASVLLGELAAAGAAWIVVHWPGRIEALLDAARAAGLDGALGPPRPR